MSFSNNAPKTYEDSLLNSPNWVYRCEILIQKNGSEKKTKLDILAKILNYRKMAEFKIFLILCLNTEIHFNFSTFLEHRGVFQKKIKTEKSGFKVENINRNPYKIFHFFLEFGENNYVLFSTLTSIKSSFHREPENIIN